MNNDKQFTVHAKSAAKYGFFGALLFVLFPIPFTLSQGWQHPALYVISAGTAIFFASVGLHFLVYRITVDGSTIRVRKGIWTNFELDVTDITCIDQIIAITRRGNNDNITVRACSRKFKVETLMAGSKKMIAYLEENVPEEKFHTQTRDFMR